MDLSDLTPQKDTYKTVLKDPRNTEEVLSNDGQEMWIERYLPHTPEFKKAQYQRTNKYLKAAQKAGNTEMDLDLFEAEQDRIEVMAETTCGWHIFFGGEWLEFSPEKAKEIYSKAFWIVEQLQSEENEADVFTKE